MEASDVSTLLRCINILLLYRPTLIAKVAGPLLSRVT